MDSTKTPDQRTADLQTISEPIPTTYVVCPGYVHSRTDGQTHFISAVQLVRLYGLPRGARWITYTDSPGFRMPLNAVILRPRADGNYVLRESPNVRP